MTQMMIRRSVQLIFMVTVLSATCCMKETYDMNKVSKKMHFSPTLAVSAIKGSVSVSDMVTSGITVVADNNKFIKIVIKKDSFPDFKLAELYSLNNMVSLSKSYTVGELSIASFNRTLPFTLGQIVNNFTNPLKTTFINLNNTNNIFPVFPSTSLGENTFPSIPNLEQAVFSSGTLTISVINNLPVTLNGLTVQLYNSVGHSAVGGPNSIPAILKGATGVAIINLANTTLKKDVIASITILGSPGSTPASVPISLTGSDIVVGIKGDNLKVKSGRVILPANAIGSSDVVSFNPGSGVEIDELKVLTGNLSYHIQKPATLSASLTISLPSAKRNGINPISDIINLGSTTIVDGNISFDNTLVDLKTDPLQTFNRLPYSLSISSTGMADFNSTDVIKLDLNLLNPLFDYVKGYFGKQVKTIDPFSFKPGPLAGDFSIANPIIKIKYLNSFAIPMQVTLNATGKKKSIPDINLDLAPFNITSGTFANRDIKDSLAVNKTNSKLDLILSMPPEEIQFAGSVTVNPAGNTGTRNNYIFGNSRFLGSLEVEVPLDFRMNLVIKDTMDNFLKINGTSKDNPVKPENFKSLQVSIVATNGFPLGVSISMGLRDSTTHTIIKTVNATDLLKPAPVDANGKANGVTESITNIELSQDFFSSISRADKIIFIFGLKTSGTGAVKIYSDNRIDYHASVKVQPDIILK